MIATVVDHPCGPATTRPTTWAEQLPDTDTALRWTFSIGHWPFSIGAIIIIATIFVPGVVAYRAGRWLQLRRRSAGPGSRWDLHHVEHPAGVTAGWSVVYGAVYAGLAWLVWPGAARLQFGTSIDAFLMNQSKSIAIGFGVLAALLLVVGPVWPPARARRTLTATLAADPSLFAPNASEAGGGSQLTPEQVVAALERRGATYRYLTDVDRSGLGLKPSAATLDLTVALATRQKRPHTGVPVSVHVFMGALGLIFVIPAADWPADWIWRSPGHPTPGATWLVFGGVVVVVVVALLAAAHFEAAATSRLRDTASPGQQLGVPGIGPSIFSGFVVVLIGSQLPSLLRGYGIQLMDALVLGAAGTVLVAGAQLLLVLWLRRWCVKRRPAG